MSLTLTPVSLQRVKKTIHHDLEVVVAENGQEGAGGRGNEKVDERKDEMLALPEVATVKAPIRRKSRVRPATGRGA